MLVTVVARECHSYQDVTANLARNNIMESLQDLGADTLYTSGQPINPIIEAEGQPKCTPITGWKFTVGSGIKEKASTGPWGALSIVTGAESPAITTQASTPLLGWNGEPISGQSLRGATTFELNKAQADRAPNQGLWIQGGTTTDPVLYEAPKFEGKYGFAALRCSIDNLNGDNVEYIKFPTGTSHAFCYAYYVTPPPGAGTIVIRKVAEGSGSVPQEFGFGGNVSYNPGGVFSLSAAPGTAGEETFVRGETRSGEDPWTVHEEVPDGWTLNGLHCDSETSQVTIDKATAKVSIRLAAGDTVTCTYVDKFQPPKGSLLLRKVTDSGVGTFHFKVLDSSGATVKTVRITTTKEGVPAFAPPIDLDPGRYHVVEKSSQDPRGTWHAVAASCNGEASKDPDEASLQIAPSEGVVCAFENKLNFHGALTIHKETIGGIGTAGFEITSPSDPTLELQQVAHVHQERTPTRAHGDSTHGLPLGEYVIQESVAGGTDPAGWRLIEVVCDGKAVPFSQGRATVHLTKSDERADCRFVNLHTSAPTPPTPGPDPRPGEAAETTVEKTLLTAGTGPTPTDTYLITIRNTSAVTASNVVVTDEPGPGLAVTSVEPSAGGTCVHDGEYSCVFASIPPHGQATVLVEATDYDGGGSWNRAVVGSGSPDGNGANNVDSATAKAPVRHFPACRPAGPAHASC